MKVALVYDRVNKWGGAERVLLALHEIWPEAVLFTSVYNSTSAQWASEFDVRTSFIQKLALPKNAHELYPFLMGLAFETLDLSDFDLVISVTSEFAKAVITRPGTVHICYCLTPVGYLWSNKENYFSDIPAPLKLLSEPVVEYLRWYDRIVASRPDYYVAISGEAQRRIRKYYSLPSKVVYPPVDAPINNNTPSNIAPGYFLIVSRLVPNKRLDIAVAAFNSLGLPLKIVGVGKEGGRLKKLAKGNIEFMGYLTDDQLSGYYRNCLALVVPGEEDFGITAVEAQSYGKPVLAYGAGGVLETVVSGKTGWLFPEQNSRSLIELIEKIDVTMINPADCKKNAERFSKKIFQDNFRNFVSHVL